MFQRVTVVGRLGRDPEMRYTPNGIPVTTFSVATERHWVDSDGQKQQQTTWFRVTAWRRLAEICDQYLTKGRLVFVEGEIAEPKPYQGRDGQWRASLDVTARTVLFLGSAETTSKSEFEVAEVDLDASTLTEDGIPF